MQIITVLGITLCLILTTSLGYSVSAQNYGNYENYMNQGNYVSQGSYGRYGNYGNGGGNYGNFQNPQPNSIGVHRIRNLLSVNVPVFYEMVKSGNNLGINVLQGLVKVERGDEAVRSGLQGPNPLSVRVFGMPVYERGFRMRSPNQPSLPPPPQEGFRPNRGEFSPTEGTTTAEPETDELPFIP